MQTYTGGCHCGAVKYEVKMELQEVVSCNCSICSKTGWLMAFTSADNFKLLQGEDNLSDYQFAAKKIHHLFCKTCGIKSFGAGTMPDGTDTRAINVGCLDGVDVESLPVKKFDGKSL
ncbi:MAG: GFA family protein [Alphaproteobacteria bacterium]|nr:GFA family protein [Alphaproteobacteria bacterium]